MAASAIGNIHVNLLVNTGSARSFTSAAGIISRDSQRMRTALSGTQRSVVSLRSSMSQGLRSRIFSDMIRQASQTNNEVAKLRASMMGLAAITGTSLTGAFAGTFLLQTADQANRLNNQLRTVADSEENLVSIRERLYAISQLSRSDMAATVTLYARLSRAAQEFGASQAEIVRVTETIQKAFAIGGATQAEASGAAIQLSQGIASDRFSGEEYRSVAENAPVLLQQMARHLGVTIGKLREMAHAGELTGKVVTDAILGASTAIDEDFNKTISTVGQGLTRLGNAFLMYIGDVDASLGITQRLAAALGNLAENMESIAPLVGGAAGLGLAAVGGRAASGALGSQIAGFRAIRAEQQASLETLVKQKTAIDQQLATNKVNLDLQRQQHLSIVASGHATNVTAKERHAASLREKASLAEIIALRQRSLMLSQQQVAVINQVTVAQRRATAAMAAMAVVQRAGSGILGMLGGWTGVAFTAAIVGIGMLSARAAEGQERTRKLTDELHQLGLISDATAGHVESVADSIDTLTADALRNKIRDIADEIDRLQKRQNPFEQLFSYDGNALGNIRQELRDMSMGYDRGPGGSADAARDVIQLMADFESGVKSSAEATAELNDMVLMPGFNDTLDEIASRLRVTFELLDGHIQHVDMLDQKLRSLGETGMETGWIEKMISQQGALEAVQGVATTLQEIVDLEVQSLSRTAEEARLLEVMNDLRKEAVERGTEEANIQESTLRYMAQQVITAENVAAASEDAARAQEDFNEKVADLKFDIDAATNSFEDLQAAATLERLLEDFATGNLRADDLKTRLSEISSVSLSDPMNDLIAKIMTAVGGLAQLLGIFNSFPGASSTPGPTYGRGGVGRARRELEAKREIALGVVSDSSANERLSERDSFINSTVGGWQSDISDAGGGGVSPEELQAEAAALWDWTQASQAASQAASSGADAATKYRDGMADLAREAAAAPLDPFLQQVLAAGESMGIASSEIDAFIASVTEGGIDAAAPKFQEIADSIQRINDSREAAQIIAENTTPFEAMFEEMSQLDGLLARGALSWEQYGRAAAGAQANAVAATLGSLAQMSGMLSQAFEDNKALSIATAVLKGGEAIASAFAAGNAIGGPPIGFAYAAIAGAASIAQIAAVSSTTENSKSLSGASGSASAGTAAVAPALPQTVNVSLQGQSYGREQIRELLEQIGSALGDGMQIRVV